MATDVLFNFYEIFVEMIFGSMGISIIAIAGVITLILLITKSAKTFIWFWLLFYFMVFGTLYLGALGMVGAFLLSTGFFFFNLLRTFARSDQ